MSEFKFSCPNCGQHIAATEAWSGMQIQCPACQRDLVVPRSPAAPIATTAVRISGAAAPAAPPPPPPPPRPSGPATRPGAPQPRTGAAPARGTSGLAITSLCLGIGSFFLTFLTGIPAVICGHMALSRIRSGRAGGGKGMAIAGLVMGYLFTVVGVVAVLMFMAAVARVKQQLTNNPPPGFVVKTDPGGRNIRVMPAAPTTQRNDPKVATDPATVTIGTGPVTGTLQGQSVKLEGASIQNGVLSLRQGQDFFADFETMIFLFLKPGETLPGKKYTITPDSGFGSPHVHLRWKDGGNSKSEALTDGYVMRLEFGQVTKQRLSGRIYLELPKSYGTMLTGTFNAEMK